MTPKAFLWWDRIKPFLFVSTAALFCAWIFLNCDREGLDFASADLRDTIPAYSSYLAKYPDPRHKLVAEKRVEELYFLKARNAGTTESYNMFLRMTPSGHLAQKARLERDRLIPLRRDIPAAGRTPGNWYLQALLEYYAHKAPSKKDLYGRMER